MSIDRQIFWPPVLLARCRDDDLRAWRMLAAGFEKPQLGMTVHRQVRVRIAHAVDVADLPSQIEDERPASHQLSHWFHASALARQPPSISTVSYE